MINKMVLNREPIKENIHIGQIPKEKYKESAILQVDRIRR